MTPFSIGAVTPSLFFLHQDWCPSSLFGLPKGLVPGVADAMADAEVSSFVDAQD